MFHFILTVPKVQNDTASVFYFPKSTTPPPPGPIGIRDRTI